MSTPVRMDLALVVRSRLALVTLALLLLTASLAVAAGLHSVAVQQAHIERAIGAQRAEHAVVASQYAGENGDAGSVGYYTFHPTWDPPSALAFAALGQRDLQPYLLRIRLLGLQSQLYESDSANPEMALPGTFDWMFVLVYLMPLVAIALMHDLITGEREAGRLGLLMATAASRPSRVWWRRILVRYALVVAAVAAPFGVGSMMAGVPGYEAGLVLVVASLYAAFWFGAGAGIASLSRSSAVSAVSMLGLWITLTLLLPTLANTAINRAVPVSRGVDLMLEQRQLVHAGWDEPKEVTFERFFVTHPEWRGTPPVSGRFHWKWYYAMHQAGDDAVAPQVDAYRRSLRERQQWAERSGWLLPGVAAQVFVQRLANTDLQSQLDYQDRVGSFHASLRRYFYPFLFRETAFRMRDFEAMPSFGTGSAQGSARGTVQPIAAVALLLLALLAAAMAFRPLLRTGSG